MRPVNPKKSKVFSFLLGVIYGYRTAHMDLKVFPIEEFKEENLEGFEIYYLSKNRDEVSKNDPIEEPSHIVALKEDLEAKEVKIYIYKS